MSEPRVDQGHGSQGAKGTTHMGAPAPRFTPAETGTSAPKALPVGTPLLPHLSNYSVAGARQLLLWAAVVFMSRSLIISAPPSGRHRETEAERGCETLTQPAKPRS